MPQPDVDLHTKVSASATSVCIAARGAGSNLAGMHGKGTTMLALSTLMEFIRPTGFWDEACKLLGICK
ncbi:hypothetical protein B5P24_04775 [Clavibacter tessellarius]|uniref:Uncharacterized protein n=1 Tax=Clavibacter tessellarius TaxID=31965 RepID=A0A225C6K0_9MICO|nr:hypothetical protein B5P24_04775 [Clavibacter michiganensis subsp. tessellarius]